MLPDRQRSACANCRSKAFRDRKVSSEAPSCAGAAVLIGKSAILIYRNGCVIKSNDVLLTETVLSVPGAEARARDVRGTPRYFGGLEKSSLWRHVAGSSLLKRRCDKPEFSRPENSGRTRGKISRDVEYFCLALVSSIHSIALIRLETLTEASAKAMPHRRNEVSTLQPLSLAIRRADQRREFRGGISLSARPVESHA